MLLSNLLIIYLIFLNFVHAQINANKRLRRLQMRPAVQWKRKLAQQQRRNEKLCYDTVGCFDIPHKRSPLSKSPENPEIIDTKFYLFRRNIKFSHPQVLRYEDHGLSLNQSSFSVGNPTKVIIHGYLSKWNDQGAIEAADTYLKIYDCNVLLVDWEKGARGPQYANAAANTEVVGRQLGILLLHMVDRGMKPENLHLIGFSLGAHVAGCASELLKIRGYLIGRITGLDAASPLFKHDHFREKHKKLDKEDAVLVDAIHTDASPFFTEGFGLLEPIGHVDFFPNGGFEQPGCVDGAASVVMSHFEGTLSRETVCSHLRAWELFLETLKRKASQNEECQFVAFQCRRGLRSFQNGQCFTQLKTPDNLFALDPSYRTEIGELGEDVRGEGVLYLVTRSLPPYCGKQLQAIVRLSQKSETTKGFIRMRLYYENGTTADWNIFCETVEFLNAGREIKALASTSIDSINEETKTITANLIYINVEEAEQNATQSMNLYFDNLLIRDMYGHSWHYCGRDTLLQHLNPIMIVLSKEGCS